jgi:mono/diheme cytochrome c family protein
VTLGKILRCRYHGRSILRALPGCIALSLLGLVGCGAKAPLPPPATPFQVDIQVKDLMNWILDPNAAVVWGAVGTVTTSEGEQRIAPTTDEQWTSVRNSAATVVESGNLLMMNGRARNQEDWMKKVQEMMRTANEALQAIEAKDAEALFTAGSDLYLACSACHAQYIFSEAGKQPADSAK